MKLTALLGGAAVSAVVMFGATAVPAHAAEAPARGVPANCPQLPWGTPGCEDYLGAAVRRDLIAQKGVALAEISDFQLGQVAEGLCFNRRDLVGIVAGNRTITYNLTSIREVTVPGRCG